jgi:hypothetical protein
MTTAWFTDGLDEDNTSTLLIKNIYTSIHGTPIDANTYADSRTDSG